MNNWNFTGNLGKDAETRHTAQGKAVVQFTRDGRTWIRT